MKSDFTLEKIIKLIESNMQPDGNVFLDAGNCGAFALHHLNFSARSPVHVSLGMGGMGNSMGLALGCALGNGKRSYIFIGDGSFLISGFEVHTAIEYTIPVTIFIFNNRSHGMCTTREEVFFDFKTGLNDFQETRFGQGMAAMFPQTRARDVSSLEELKTELADMEAAGGINILSLNVENEFPPFKSFLKK